ncbi:hypothetical protein M2R28_03065 [Aeromonas hydrophila]|uniref:hypothetical protein n=1 Tax=Aeromonas hydrophila TaxID=644 RepID=UPI001C5ADF0B|nr:hypothetical protein [Aeromonas hydrophila]MBW3809074.1 hypothetical protein [Aeromonas hydrophila]MCO4198670.1 hypothetical protein [Aeromonas hydrophila]UNB60006.1 hypothetical protein MKW86_07945 [Aeromonas hydrophila]
MIDFSHPQWRELARQLLDNPTSVVRARQWQPLLGLLKDNQLLLALGNHHYELTPAGRRYLTRELTLAEIATAPPTPEEWLHGQGWQLAEQVNERVLAALYRKSEVSFSPNEQIDFEDKGIRLCADQLLRLRAPQSFSLFFSGGTLLDAAPWLQALGEVALPERNLAGLGKILWGEGELLRVITTDSVGAFAELVLPVETLLVWAPVSAQQALQQVIAALPPQVQWSHLTSLDPSGVDRVLTLAQRLGRPASWWLPTSLAPIMGAYALPLTDSRPWEPSRIPKSLLAVCSGLVESNGGLSAEVCALAPQWHAIG